MRMVTPLYTGTRTGDIIIFFPHAGGSPRFFTHLAAAMPQHCVFGITYPGRDHLIDATPITDIAVLSAHIAEELTAQFTADKKPLILVGHSLGAFIAYETAVALNSSPTSLQTIVVASGQNPPLPHCLAQMRIPTTDAGIVSDVLRQNPASAPVWESPELRSFFLPVVRADYELLGNYQPSLGCVEEITVIFGDQDTEVEASLMPGWQQLSRQTVDVVVAKGGHFYLTDPDVQLAQELLRITTTATYDPEEA